MKNAVYYLYLRHEGRSEVLQKWPLQVVQFAAIHSVFNDGGIVVPTVPLLTVVKNKIKNTVLYCIVDLQVISFSYKIESSGHLSFRDVLCDMMVTQKDAKRLVTNRINLIE